MKKLLSLLMVIVMVFSFCACGSSEEDTSQPSDSGASQAPVELETDDNESAAESSKGDSNYDVDLTALSSTMVYSEVYNMMLTPEEYIGKTVKMEGSFAIYEATDENGQPVPGAIYFACIIADATACCSQGLEFVLDGDFKYPDDYPELDSDITVSGTFETYEEDGMLFCHLVNAKLH